MPIGGGDTAIITPMPVTVQGGELRILEGVPVATTWSGPYGYNAPYPRNRYQQITTDDPGVTWVDGDGATASDEAKVAGEWTDAQKTRFETEFPTARPGLLYGIYFISFGNERATIDDMYNSDTNNTKVYRDRFSWAYTSKFFSLGTLFEPRVTTGGMWEITFPKPIPFHIGLRVSWDSGSGYLYFLHSLDPSFA